MSEHERRDAELEKMIESDKHFTYVRDGVVWCVWTIEEGCDQLRCIEETRAAAEQEAKRARDSDPDLDVWIESWLVAAGPRPGPTSTRRPKPHGILSKHPERMSGALCWDHTRIPVADTLSWLLIGGVSLEEYLEDFPGFDREHLHGLVDALQQVIREDEAGK